MICYKNVVDISFLFLKSLRLNIKAIFLLDFFFFFNFIHTTRMEMSLGLAQRRDIFQAQLPLYIYIYLHRQAQAYVMGIWKGGMEGKEFKSVNEPSVVE